MEEKLFESPWMLRRFVFIYVQVSEYEHVLLVESWFKIQKLLAIGLLVFYCLVSQRQLLETRVTTEMI